MVAAKAGVAAPRRVVQMAAGAAGPLAAVLGRHTGTPQRCWFAVWDGSGGLPERVRRAPGFTVPERRYHLLAGALSAADTSVLDAPCWQTANLWWPDDRAWCVASEIDLNSTYLGVTEACAAELLAEPDLEAVRVSPEAGIAFDSDPDNPPPPHG